MCFLEFIGYTCGHTSLPVLRACPLTTASHTFPTCTLRADKPFLAGEMCSACQKIIHSRATQIEEYEHRFMHERGVCGCDTIFPYLIRPRFIGSRPDSLAEDGEEGSDDATSALPPLLDETDGDGCAVVSVRLPSLFAAEWVVDHRARHEAGLCRCRVDFRTFQEAMEELEEEADMPFAEGGNCGDCECGQCGEQTVALPVENAGTGEDDSNGSASYPLCVGADPRRTVSSSPPRWRRRYGDGDRGGPMDGRRESSTDGYTASMSRTRSHDRGDTASPISSPDGEERLEGRQEVAWLSRCDNEMNVDGGCGDGVRFAGAIFTEVPAYLPITGPFLMQPSPYGVSGGSGPVMDGIMRPAEAEAEGAHEVAVAVGADGGTDGSSSSLLLLWSPTEASTDTTVDEAATDSSTGLPCHQPMPACTRVPLVGLPIGAGPEGVLHALPWEGQPRCWSRV